jgi:hypothetical protein
MLFRPESRSGDHTGGLRVKLHVHFSVPRNPNRRAANLGTTHRRSSLKPKNHRRPRSQRRWGERCEDGPGLQARSSPSGGRVDRLDPFPWREGSGTLGLVDE